MKIFPYKASDPKIMDKAKKMFAELDKDTEYIVTIKKNHPIRSNDANRYYRSVLKIIGIHTGETTDRLHMLFKMMFNYEEFVLPDGTIERIPATTKEKNVKEFAKYTNRVKQWAIDEYQIYFPGKHDLDYMREMDIENQYDKIQG